MTFRRNHKYCIAISLRYYTPFVSFFRKLCDISVTKNTMIEEHDNRLEMEVMQNLLNKVFGNDNEGYIRGVRFLNNDKGKPAAIVEIIDFDTKTTNNIQGIRCEILAKLAEDINIPLWILMIDSFNRKFYLYSVKNVEELMAYREENYKDFFIEYNEKQMLTKLREIGVKASSVEEVFGRFLYPL